MKPDLIFTLYKLGQLYSEELPDIAISMINQGIENDYMIEIAGLNRPKQQDLIELMDKAFMPYLNDRFDSMTMALIIAKSILDDELKPYEGAKLIGEIYEGFDKNEELWKFKCHVIQYDDYQQDEQIGRLGFDRNNLQIWQNEIIEEIKNDAKLLIAKFDTD